MRSYFNNKWSFFYRTLRICLILLLFFVVVGYLEFLYYAKINNIEWSSEASDAYIVFDSTNLEDLRLIYVSHTPFGERMQNELLLMHQMQSPSLIIQKRKFYKVAAPSAEALHKKAYLDLYAVLHLQVIYFFNALRNA